MIAPRRESRRPRPAALSSGNAAADDVAIAVCKRSQHRFMNISLGPLIFCLLHQEDRDKLYLSGDRVCFSSLHLYFWLVVLLKSANSVIKGVHR